jgi:hypothetical protein
MTNLSADPGGMQPEKRSDCDHLAQLFATGNGGFAAGAASGDQDFVTAAFRQRRWRESRWPPAP